MQIAYPKTAYEKTANPSENAMQPSKSPEGGYTTQQRNPNVNSFQSTNDFVRNRIADFTQVQSAAKNGQPFPLQPAALNVYGRKIQIAGEQAKLDEVNRKLENPDLNPENFKNLTGDVKKDREKEYEVLSLYKNGSQKKIADWEQQNSNAVLYWDMVSYDGLDPAKLSQRPDFMEKSKYLVTQPYTALTGIGLDTMKSVGLGLFKKEIENPAAFADKYRKEILEGTGLSGYRKSWIRQYLELDKNQLAAYNYLFTVGGKALAERYAKLIFESKGLARGEARAAEGGAWGLSHRGYDVMTGLSDSGDSFYNAFDAITRQATPQETLMKDYEMAAYRYHLSGAERFVSDVTQGASGMLPAVGASFINPGLGVATMFTQSFGSNFQYAMNSGKSYNQALTYAAVTATIESAAQYALGGIGRVSSMAVPTKLASALTKVGGRLASNPAVQKVITVLASVGAQGFEETLTSAANSAARNLMLDEQNGIKEISEDALYNGLLGMFTSLVLNLGSGNYTKPFKKTAVDDAARCRGIMVVSRVGQGKVRSACLKS